MSIFITERDRAGVVCKIGSKEFQNHVYNSK